MPGVEERLRLIYDAAVSENRMSLERFVEVCAATPAKMFGLYPKKGTIAVGSDADIIVWDPTTESKMSVEVNHMGVDYSAYEGREVAGKIDMVLSRGRVLIEADEYHGAPGDGDFLPRGTNQYLI